jgi:hypothetical protein
MQEGRVRIKYRDLEIEVEGSEKFIDSYLSKTFGDSLNLLSLSNQIAVEGKLINKEKDQPKRKTDNFELLVKKMKVKNIEDLIIASAYYWSVIKKIKSYPEHDLYKTVTMEKKLYKKYGGKFKETFSKLIENGTFKHTNGNYELSIAVINTINEKIQL